MQAIYRSSHEAWAQRLAAVLYPAPPEVWDVPSMEARHRASLPDTSSLVKYTAKQNGNLFRIETPRAWGGLEGVPVSPASKYHAPFGRS